LFSLLTTSHDVEILFRQQFRRDLRDIRFKMDFDSRRLAPCNAASAAP
jgi:hypothetical protein